MPTYYTVVRCVPDVVADERVNIGVIVWGDGHIRSRFLSDWRRVQAIGVKDVSFVREFIERVSAADANQLALPGLEAEGGFSEMTIRRAIDSWAGLIQFSPVRSSLRDPDTVLEDVSRRFLRVRQEAGERLRSRQAVANLTQREVEDAVRERLGVQLARHLVRKNYRLAGRLEEHQVDVGIVNGLPHLAARGLSFDIRSIHEMSHHYTDTLFMASDLKDRMSDLLFGVVIYAPRESATPQAVELYERAVHVLPQAGAVVVGELEAATWARDVVANIPEEELGILQ
jgi:hypothetical protein